MGNVLIGVVICWTLLGAQAAATRPTVALLDFDFGSVQQRWSGNQDIGKGISDLIVDEVVNDGSFRVIERKRRAWG